MAQKKSIIKISAQEFQDRIFSKMSARKKLAMVNDFFVFAKILNKEYFDEQIRIAKYGRTKKL